MKYQNTTILCDAYLFSTPALSSLRHAQTTMFSVRTDHQNVFGFRSYYIPLKTAVNCAFANVLEQLVHF